MAGIPTHDPCIQSVFLKDITAAYDKTPKLESLLFDDFFNKGELHPSGIVLTSEYSFLDSNPSGAARVEACRCTEHSMGYTDAGFHHRSVVLRRLQERDCPCQPTASATRLLRCSHFPRPARKRERALRHWPEHPCVFLSLSGNGLVITGLTVGHPLNRHQLDWPWWKCLGRELRRIGQFCHAAMEDVLS